jgi:hypothetical protein
MANLSKYSIDWQNIIPPTNPLAPSGDNRFSNNEERSLYTAYLAHLETADTLANAKPQLFQDAWINLNLAVECFLKHLYCLCRDKFSSFAKPLSRWPMGPWEYDGAFHYLHKSAKGGGLPSIQDFGHEVIELWLLLDTFTSAHNSPEFAGLKQHIESQKRWIDTRYGARNHAIYKQKYADYQRDFDAVRTVTFGRFK